MKEQSFLIYNILLFTMTICGVIASRRSRTKPTLEGRKMSSTFWTIEITISLLLFSIIFGMRYNVGIDYSSYLNYYINGLTEKIEPLFAQITLFCANMNFHYSIYFGILAFIQVFFFYYAFKDEKYLYPFLAFILIANMEFFSWMNIIRQSIAICIWIYSIKFIEQKKLLWYILGVVTAYLFHRSAIILLIFYPLLYKGKDYFSKTLLQFVILASAFGIRYMFERLIGYLGDLSGLYISLLGRDFYERGYNIDALLGSFKEQTGTGIAIMFKIIVNIIIILYSKKMKSFYNCNRFIIIYFFYFIGLITTYIFPDGFISFTRPFRYFYIFQSVILAYFLYYLNKNKSTQNIVIFWGLIISFLGIFYLKIYTSAEDSYFLYQFFFDAQYLN